MDHAFAAGFASATAELCTMPIDTVKVRLQLNSSTGINRAWPVARGIIRTEGWRVMFRGCSAALTRQSLYTAFTFGMYNGSGIKRDTFAQKLLSGGSMGCIGVAMVNPVDVVKVRMQSGQYPEYRGIVHGLRTVWSQDGIQGLGAGVAPAMQRAFVVNAMELATYDQAKQTLAPYFADLPVTLLHFAASVVAGGACVAASNPFDVAKTRLMSAAVPTSLISCLVTTIRAEGFLALYKGALANWMRKGPHCTLQFILYEK
eukprot:gene8823-13672_t